MAPWNSAKQDSNDLGTKVVPMWGRPVRILAVRRVLTFDLELPLRRIASQRDALRCPALGTPCLNPTPPILESTIFRTA